MTPRVVVSGPIRHGQVRVSWPEPIELVYGPSPVDGAYVGRDRGGSRVRVLPRHNERTVEREGGRMEVMAMGVVGMVAAFAALSILAVMLLRVARGSKHDEAEAPAAGRWEWDAGEELDAMDWSIR